MNPQLYDDLKTEIIKRLGNRSDLTTRADQWINDAFTDLAQSPKASFRELDASQDFTVVAAQQTLEMPGDAWFILSLRMIDRKLDQIHWQVIDRTYRTQGMPTRYARYQDHVEFDPIPDKNYNMTMRYRRRLPNLVAGMAVPIEREWHELLIQLTVSKGLQALQRFEEAAMYQQVIDGMTSQKNDTALLEDDNYETTIAVRFR